MSTIQSNNNNKTDRVSIKPKFTQITNKNNILTQSHKALHQLT